MGLEIITQPQIFLGGLTALGPGIQGLTEQYPLLTTYYSWTSTGVVNASAFPIPIGVGSMYEGPGKEASFIISVGGVIQHPSEYTINTTLRTITFNTIVSAGIEVAATQLATASPSSQSFDYIESVKSYFNNLTATNANIQNLLVTNLTALSSTLTVTDIKVYEIDGYTVTGDLNVQGTTTSQELNVTNALINSLSTNYGVLNLDDFYSETGEVDSLFVTRLSSSETVLTSMTATDTNTRIALISGAVVQKLTAVDVKIDNGSINVQSLTGRDTFINDLTGTNIISTNNFYGNLSGSLQIQNVSVKTDQLRNYFQLKAAVDRCVRAIFVSTNGTGYSSTPQVVIDPPAESWGKQAHAVATVAANQVTSITVIEPGSGYTRTPNVTIVGGNGTGATATALSDGNPLGENNSNYVCSDFNTTILCNDGQLYSWGLNAGFSEIGGGLVNHVMQKPTPFIFNIASLSGENHIPRVVKYWKKLRNVYVIDQRGYLWASGNNGNGQLGAGDVLTRRALTRIQPSHFDNDPVVSFAATDGVTGAVLNDSNLTCIAKTSKNVIYGWGYNGNVAGTGGAALGFQSGGSSVLVPTRIITATRNSHIQALSSSIDNIYIFGGRLNFAANNGYSYVTILSTGAVWCAGTNTANSLPVGLNPLTQAVYNPVISLSSVKTTVNTVLTGVRTIISGGNALNNVATFFIDSNKALWTTGSASYNGTGTSVASAALLTTNVEFAAAGYSGSAAPSLTLYVYKSDGTLIAWGNNDQGQAGVPRTDTAAGPLIASYATPQTVLSAVNDVNNLITAGGIGEQWTRYLIATGRDGVTWGPGAIRDIAAGQRSALILRTDGSLYALGYNIGVQLGTLDTQDRWILQRVGWFPRPVSYISLQQVIQDSAGAGSSSHAIVVLQDGTVYGAGNNSNRQANPDTGVTSVYTFTPINLGTPVQQYTLS